MSRFHEPQHPDFVRMNTSVGFDRRLWPQDIAQSRAHAKMLAAQEIISGEDRDALLRGLDEVQRELEQGQFVFVDGDEDIHMAIERHLTELVGAGRRQAAHGPLAQRPGRDRPRYVYARARARGAGGDGAADGALVERAEQHIDWPLPGYTHLQRAQPVYLGHHLLAYFWMLARDRERFAFAERQCSRLPLGAGALAGVNFDTDRQLVARELGFDEPVPNSIDAVANRDFALDYLSAAATCATHLSRLGAELVLWSEQRVRLLRAARRLECRLLDHAAEEEPRRGRALARQGPARGRPSGGLARRDARAAADLQQGPAGGQGAPVRRGRHA